jgi:hypothetical protein
MACCTGPIFGSPTSNTGSLLSTSAATCEMCTWQLPLAKGTLGFTSNTTARALAMAAMV